VNEQPEKSVKVFYVPFNRRNFIEHLLKTAISKTGGNDYSGILCLSPTHLKVKENLKIFYKLTDGACIPPAMMTIKQLSKKIYSLYGNKTPVSKSIIPIVISRLSGRNMGFSSVIGSFIDELKQYCPYKSIDTVSQEFKKAFEELNVPEEGSKRAMDAIELFRKYQETLSALGLIDDNDVMAECPAIIEKHNYSPSILILDGFYEITPLEELIVKSLIEKAKTSLISIFYDKKFASITDCFDVFIKNNFKFESAFLEQSSLLSMGNKGGDGLAYTAYQGVDEEIEGIARHIKNQFISGRCRDLGEIAVAFPDLHPYRNSVERTFRRYGIPCSFSASKPLEKAGPFAALMALLESVAEDYPRLQFSRFLASPYIKKNPAIFTEWIPLISLYSGIIKSKNSWLGLSATLSTVKNPALREILPEMEKELKRTFKKLKPLETLREKGSFRQISEAVRNLLSELDLSAGDAAPDAKERISGFLNELSFIDNFIRTDASAKSGLREFIDGLRHILNAAEAEGEGEGVRVSGLFELRCAEPEYLYLGGLRDGDLPSMPEIDLLLPDNVKTRLGLVNMKKYLNLQHFIFTRLTGSSKNLHLSYPAMEADKLFLPSPFLPWKAGVSERIPGILCMEGKLLRQAGAPFSAHTKEIAVTSGLVKRQFGEKSGIRVTDIDAFRVCHRKFFIEKILGLEPLKIKEYEIEAILLGTIIHEVMEKLMSRSFANFDDMRSAAEELFEKLLDGKPLEDYWKMFIKKSFLSILPEIYEIETALMAEGYSFLRAEASIEAEIIKGIKLKGKIDRIDKKVRSEKLEMKNSQDNEVELIDYKTGSAQLSKTEILNKGANLQLFLYAALMKTLGFKVNRSGIYSLKDTKITWIPGKKDDMTMDDYMELCLKYLEKSVSDLRNGDFSALPLNEQTCRNCHERAYCPYIQTTS